MIPVTKPFQPPIEEYKSLIDDIWNRNWFTNNGPILRELEERLRDYLELENLIVVGNGTIALQIAIKSLGLTKKILTTPFSYIATTSSILWEECKPVFVDIDQKSFNINPDLIEEALDDETEAILATHCFGNPCDINRIDLIAKKYNLKVIYDAAHCFGTKYKGRSVFEYGDISTISFHATKPFHMVEGGAIVTTSANQLREISYRRNFGHDGPEKFHGVGINGKNSELHAAMGIVNLRYIEDILRIRKELSMFYTELLVDLPLETQEMTKHTDYNFSYYPVLFESEEVCLLVKSELEEASIFPRRYFYPSLSSLDFVAKSSTPISDDIASRILCLPLYHDLTEVEIRDICDIIRKTIQQP